MSEMACAICVKRHETGNPRAALQCRANPPVQDVGRDAIYPTVQPDFYCHDAFALDAAAKKARDAASAETADLDAKVAATAAPRADLLTGLEASPAAAGAHAVRAAKPKTAAKTK